MASKHASRENDANDREENAIGLTEAFAPVDDEEEEEPRPRGRHARHAATPIDFDEDDFEEDDEGDEGEDDDWEDTGEFPAVSLATMSPEEGSQTVRDSHNMTRSQKKAAKRAARENMPAYMKKSRRTRRILTVVVVLLVLLAAAGVYFVSQLISTVGDTAAQQAQMSQDTQDTSAIDATGATDASSAEKTTTVPNLTGLLGKTQEEATAAVGRGATVAMDREVSQEGSAIVREVRLSLNDEPADARIGVPTVYLGMNAEGVIVQAGYSAATSALGYGPSGFADAVQKEHIVEETLREAGADVADGAAVLPEDSTVYSTYGPDGTTLTREYCSFGGSVAVDGTDCVWSAILSYDYNTANATGNLADTVRTIYVYIDSPDAIAPVVEEDPAAQEEAAE